MPFRHFSVTAVLLVLATAAPAKAQGASLPAEPQIGPRPFYLVGL